MHIDVNNIDSDSDDEVATSANYFSNSYRLFVGPILPIRPSSSRFAAGVAELTTEVSKSLSGD